MRKRWDKIILLESGNKRGETFFDQEIARKIEGNACRKIRRYENGGNIELGNWLEKNEEIAW